MSSEVVSIRPSLTLHASFWGKALSGIKSGADTRVLEVGCGRGESLALLATKKIDAYGFDLGAASGQLLAPKSQFAFGSLSSAMSYPQHHFDAVIVRPMPSFRGELATAEHYVATANLLSCVKAGGRMIIVEPTAGRDGATSAEWLARWNRQIEAFTVEKKTLAYKDGGLMLALFGWLNKGPRLDLQLIQLTIPQAPVSRLEWHRQARSAAMPKTRNSRKAA
ncbi:MAG TPA: methyltransferase domain-containing protein [Caulifigura sp.]|jgi:SAM-dependent methyltransferase|nr:methyltransferase domain-containing protein [Caulifigura sp.]